MKYKKMIFKIALKIANYDKRKEFDDLIQTGFPALYEAYREADSLGCSKIPPYVNLCLLYSILLRIYLYAIINI